MIKINWIIVNHEIKLIKIKELSLVSLLLCINWHTKAMNNNEKLVIKLKYITTLWSNNEWCWWWWWLCPIPVSDKSLSSDLWIKAAIIPSSLQRQWINDELRCRVSQPLLSHKLNWIKRKENREKRKKNKINWKWNNKINQIKHHK